jgi:hypothetical protein
MGGSPVCRAPLKPFGALDFRPARGDFGARLAGLI